MILMVIKSLISNKKPLKVMLALSKQVSLILSLKISPNQLKKTKLIMIRNKLLA